MKKLIVFLAVLAVCATANAVVISLEREGETIVMTPGGSITLYVATNGPLLGFDVIVSVSGDATITGAMSLSDCAYYGWDPMIPVSPIWISPKSVAIGGGNFNGNYMPIIGYVTVQYDSGTAIVSASPGSFWGGSQDMNLNPPEVSLGVVTLIPEPVTLVLLGLGGLFIRRRK